MNDPPREAPTRATGRPDSLVLVNTGDGKGKSTAAFGTMLRAVARGWRVAVVQFVKSGDWHVGEQRIAEQLGVDWFSLGAGFTWDSNDLDHDIAVARDAFAQAAAIVRAGQHELVILDELTYLCTWGWVPTGDVVALVEARPADVNLIVTGRDAPPELVAVADTVTEMRKVKHAFDAGIAAKRGLDH
jgi:cob(I)alamin adenosyltransferase